VFVFGFVFDNINLARKSSLFFRFVVVVVVVVVAERCRRCGTSPRRDAIDASPRRAITFVRRPVGVVVSFSLFFCIFVFVPKRDDSAVVAPRAPDNRCAMDTLDVFASGFDVRFLAGMDAGSYGSSVEISEAPERASRRFDDVNRARRNAAAAMDDDTHVLHYSYEPQGTIDGALKRYALIEKLHAAPR
jgi:hypothetical protein